MEDFQHRPTTKHKNKPFKGRFASKREKKQKAKGRIEMEKPRSEKENVKKTFQTGLSKSERKNQSKQKAKNKREELLKQRRGLEKNIPPPPRMCVIIHLDDLEHRQPNPGFEEEDNQLLTEREKKILSLLHSPIYEDETLESFVQPVVFSRPSVPSYLYNSQFKSRFGFVVGGRSFQDILNSVKVAEVILFVVRVEAADAHCTVNKLSDRANQLLSIIKAQGLPTPFILLEGLGELEGKIRTESKRYWTRLFETEFFSGLKVLPIDTKPDAAQVHRFLGNSCKLRTIHWREQRPYIVVESFSFQPNDENLQEGEKSGTLTVKGYVHGRNLSANQLLYIPTLGVFVAKRIIEQSDPHAAKARTTASNEIIHEPDPSQLEPLLSEAIPVEGQNGDEDDEFDYENEDDEEQDEQRLTDNLIQQFGQPDSISRLKSNNKDNQKKNKSFIDEDIENIDNDPSLANETKPKIAPKKKKVPKGTSSYQAAWIIDQPQNDEENDEDAEDAEDVGGGEDDEDENDNAQPHQDEKGDQEESDMRDGGEDDDKHPNDEEEEWQEQDDQDEKPEHSPEEIKKLKEKARKEEEQDDLMYPDEVDTPEDIPARVRFQKYRGLKSFRNSDWDPKESLPVEYSKIYQFQSIRQSMKRANLLQNEAEIPIGAYVTIELKDVPEKVKELWDESQRMGVRVVCGLLKYENRMSVVHFLVSKNPTLQTPVPSKSEFYFHCGFLQFLNSALFSENTFSEKRKLERFLHNERPSIASVYCPVIFPPAPVLMFDRNNGQLVASGTVDGVNPDRLLIKRIILSGHPLKCHKRKAILRYMFFNPEDVRWFKVVDLWTKHGRTGHILEPVGTHGNMKCIFDSHIHNHDSVCMSLYKRVFPPWPTHPVSSTTSEDHQTPYLSFYNYPQHSLVPAEVVGEDEDQSMEN